MIAKRGLHFYIPKNYNFVEGLNNSDDVNYFFFFIIIDLKK
jgi:hypothetical protein